MKDLKQAVIDAIHGLRIMGVSEKERIYNQALENAEFVVLGLPFAQPEIIRCGQCKYAEVADPEDSQDGYTCQFHRGSIWFSGSFCSWAERRTDE